MKFTKLTAHNIFSYHNFSLDLSDRGLVLVTGKSFDEGSSNGSGKSSLINKSLLWVLFGQTAEGLKTSDVINRHFKDATATAVLEFEIGADKYAIQRTRTKTSGTLQFYKNNEDISLRDSRETQEAINHTVGHTLSSFVQTDFFGQGNSTPFMKLSPSGRKEILEKLLPFEYLDEWENNAKVAKKKIVEERQVITISHERSLASIEALNQQLKRIEAQKVSWKVENSNEIKKLKAQISSTDITEALNKKSEIEKGLSELKSQWNFQSLEKSIQKKHKENLELTDDSNRLLNKKSHIERDLVRLKSQLNEICPTCNQKTPRNWTKDKKIIVQQQQLEATLLEIDRAIGINDSLFSMNKGMLDTYIKVKQEYSDLETSLIELEEQVDFSRIEQLKIKIKELEEAKNPFEETIASITSSITEAKKLENEQSKKLETIMRDKTFVEDWERAFGKDLRVILYNKVCPFLTERTNYHLQKLNNSQITVKFSTIKTNKDNSIKEDLDVTVNSVTGGNSYQNLSGGEQQIVDFSVGLALADLAATQNRSRSNILILDEPFVGLDSRNSEAIVDYLSEEISKFKDSVFLISNEDNLKGLIPSQILVEKENGISKIFPA